MEFSLGDFTVATAVVGDGISGQIEVTRASDGKRKTLTAALPPDPADAQAELERLAVLYLRHQPYASRITPEVRSGIAQATGRHPRQASTWIEWLETVEEASHARFLVRPDLRSAPPPPEAVGQVLDEVVSAWTRGERTGAPMLACDVPMGTESDFVREAVAALKAAFPGEVVATLCIEEIGLTLGRGGLDGDRVALRVGDRFYDANQTAGTSNPARLLFVEEAIRSAWARDDMPDGPDLPDEDAPAYALG